MSQPLIPPSNPFAALVFRFLNPDRSEFNETMKQGAKEVLGLTLQAVGNKLRTEPDSQPTTKKQGE